jgi:hypothetical protein
MKRRNIKIFWVMCLAGFINLNSNAQPEQVYWSQFRGPNCSGLALSDARPPTEFGEDKNLLWKIDLPEGTSSPVIWENKIYLTAFVQNNAELQTLCIEGSSGKIIWTRSVFPEKFEKFHPISNPAQATVAVDESGVYAYFASYGIQSYTHNGEMRWDLPLPVIDWVDYGHASSPVVMDDKLLKSVQTIINKGGTKNGNKKISSSISCIAFDHVDHWIYLRLFYNVFTRSPGFKVIPALYRLIVDGFQNG